MKKYIMFFMIVFTGRTLAELISSNIDPNVWFASCMTGIVAETVFNYYDRKED